MSTFRQSYEPRFLAVDSSGAQLVSESAGILKSARLVANSVAASATIFDNGTTTDLSLADDRVAVLRAGADSSDDLAEVLEQHYTGLTISAAPTGCYLTVWYGERGTITT